MRNVDEDNKIKILLKGSKSNIHPVYQEIIEYPPNHCNIFTKSINKLSIDRLVSASGYYLSLPNMGIASQNADLIHSCQQLILNRIPWVIDIDHSSALVYFQNRNSKADTRIIRKYLSSKYCKKIMPWCNAAKTSLDSLVNTVGFADKIETVYPAMHPIKFDKINQDTINFIFVGRDFYIKGGIETLMAFEVLAQKYDIKLTMISDVPKDIKNKYSKFDSISFHKPLPRGALLEKFYPSADIFIFPTLYEIFGMVFLEAMAFSLPIITLYGFATPEIVENEKNGYLIKPYSKLWFDKNYLRHPQWGNWNTLKLSLKTNEQRRVVNDLIEKMSILIENDSLRRNMGEYGRNMIENGKFSIKERNKKLERIYKEAIE